MYKFGFSIKKKLKRTWRIQSLQMLGQKDVCRIHEAVEHVQKSDLQSRRAREVHVLYMHELFNARDDEQSDPVGC